MNIVLIEPEIPWNTGNIGRTCLAAGAELHIIGQPGFFLEQKDIKRAGLDYWKYLKVNFHNSLMDYFSIYKENPYYFFSAHSSKQYTQIRFSPLDSLIFGKESEGLGQKIIGEYAAHIYRIPVKKPVRSLNLSTAVGIVVYEGVRQLNSCEDKEKL